jgi:hypothetical protein
MTTYLKFPDEATARAVLADYLIDDEWALASHTHALDPVGAILKPTGVKLFNNDGDEYEEMAPIPGYHINFIGVLPDAAQPYVVEPTNPVRMFAV